MAVNWGPAINTSTNGARVGLDVWVSGSGSSRTVNWALWLWTKRASYTSSGASYRVSATGVNAITGSSNYNHTNNSRDWPTSNRTRFRTGSFSVGLNYGSTQRVTVSATITGISAVPGTARHSRSVTLPARPYSRPSAPGAPTWTSDGDTRTTIRWSRNSTTAAPYQSQRVQRRTYNNGWGNWVNIATLSGTSSSYTDRGTVANRVYQWRIQARNSAGSRLSSSSSARYTSPWHATNLRVQNRPAGIVLSWENRVRYGAYEYQIQHQPGGSSGPWNTVATISGGAHGTRSSWTLRDPDLTVTHRLAIRARTTTGALNLTSGWSYSSVVELAAPPNAPTNLGPSGAWDAAEDRTFTWLHVPTDGSDQEAFQIRHRGKGGDWTTVPEVASEASGWTLPGGTYENGLTVEWQVRTWGVHPDPGPWSATQFTVGTARPTVAINAPEDDDLIDTSQVTVEWGFDQEEGRAQTGWRLDLYDGHEVVQERSGTDARNSLILTELEDETDYRLVVAVRSAGGLWSEDDEVTFRVEYVSPQAPVVASVSWDVDRGAAAVEIEQAEWDEDYAEPDYHQVWRAVGDGPFVLIADEVPLDTTVLDPIPAVGDGTRNRYRVVTVSVLPSTARSEPVELEVSTRDTRGWCYLNAGEGMGEMCRVRANVERSGNFGVVKELRQYAGRTAPVEHAGIAVERSWGISARVAPNPDGASTIGDLEALQQLPAPVCYRDPIGVRWFGSMGEISDSWAGIVGEVSWSMTATDYTEGQVTDVWVAPETDDDGDDDDEGEAA